MHSAFVVMVTIVGIGGCFFAIVSLLTSGKVWEEFGRHRLSMDSDQPSGARRPAGGAASQERDAEIRQLLAARNALRARRGEPPLDAEAELARLGGPHIDPELRAEIRDLVVARNHRRARQGKPPLDVEAEIQREIASLSGL